MAVATTDRLLAEMLSGYGVTHVFFVPSVLTNALAEMEDMNITRVTAHHEIAAAIMADGYARVSRRPGVCMAQSVGAAHLAAGLRDACLASSPVIAFTGGPHPDSRYRHVYQMLEDFPMFDPVTKFNARVERPGRLGDLLRQAFRESVTGSPGPVHLEIPGNIGDGLGAKGEFQVIVEEEFGRLPVYRPEPEMARVHRAADLLASAERPVIVAGGGVILSGATAEVVRLAEMLSIPVATSPSGKGTIAENHPLAVGMVGSYGRRCTNRIVEEADLVFFVGSRAGGMTTNKWRTPPPGTRVIQLDVDQAEIGRNYPVEAGLLGDAKVTLQRLIEAASPAGPRDAWLRRTEELREKWLAEMAPLMSSDASPMRPERICKEITEFLPENAVIVADTGHAGIWSGTMIELRKPGQRSIRCAGTLGWAFPASIGVKAALPDAPVFCFLGDGGFYPHLVELETAARHGINVIVLLNDNAALSQPRGLFDAAYGGTQRGRAHQMWVFEKTDFTDVARSFGCLGIRVERPGDLRGAFEQALAAGRPTVIDMISDRDAMAVFS